MCDEVGLQLSSKRRFLLSKVCVRALKASHAKGSGEPTPNIGLGLTASLRPPADWFRRSVYAIQKNSSDELRASIFIGCGGHLCRHLTERTLDTHNGRMWQDAVTSAQILLRVIYDGAGWIKDTVVIRKWVE